MSESAKKTCEQKVLTEEKSLPKIATRCLILLMQIQRGAWKSAIEEAAESIGLDLKDGWKLNGDAKAFVREKEKE